MREKKRETARALKDEAAKQEAKQAANRRDETLRLYLERAERQTDAAIFGSFEASGDEFLAQKSFAN